MLALHISLAIITIAFTIGGGIYTAKRLKGALNAPKSVPMEKYQDKY